MGKFENELQSNKSEEWKDKYINYNSLKQNINQYLADMSSKNINDLTQIEKNEIITNYINEFTKELDKEIRKVYVLYSKEEKHLYKNINKYLHIKDDFDNYTLDDYLTQYSELKDLSVASFKISKFVYYNLKSLIKILKKFDKKIIGSKDKENQIQNSYVISKLEDQNSDILYLINLKMIDEVNVILEDLIKSLKDSFKQNKNKYKDSIIDLSNYSNSKNENLIDKKSLNLNDTSVIIDCFHKEIKDNIKNVDKMSNNIIMLFMPWKEFLRISGDVGSKLIQLSKELNSFSESVGSSDSNAFKNSKSIVDTISFSKQNSYNIYITFFHGFIYMFSFSCILPHYPELIKDQIKSGLLMMMAPIGAIISYTYESSWFKKSTKVPLVISCVGILLGNFFYYIYPFNQNCLIFIFIGRFLIGLFNLRTHNKMYIMNFLLRKDVSYYLTLFHTFSMFGLSCGFLLNLINMNFDDKFGDNKADNIINKFTFGPFLSIIFSLILLILSLKFFTEARSSNFNMTSIRSFSSIDSSNLIRDSTFNTNLNSENISRIQTINEDENNKNNLITEASINEEITENVRKKSIMVNDLNDQLGDFNRKSNFNDTNLVSLSVSQLTYKEKEGLQYLFKSFFVYLFIVFTTKFISEAIFINLPIFRKEEEKDWITPTLLGCSCLIVLVIEYALKNKNKFITEKKLLIILFILNFIINFALVFLVNNKSLVYYIILGLSLVFSNIIEKYATHFFNYIIPQNYIVCKIQGNIFINIISMISRIFASILVMAGENEFYESIIFILNFIFSLICTVLFVVFYSDIRIKSISRILSEQGKDEIKIASEI